MNNPSVFQNPRPEFGAAEAASLLLRDYGLSGRLKPLVSERDQNFLVEGPAGAAGAYVLKISNLAEDPAFLDLQNAVLDHLAKTDPDLGVQRLLPTRAGEKIARWPGPSGAHAVRVLTYLPGNLYSATPASPELLASLGGFMGRLSLALRGFGHPAAHRAGFLWNLDEAIDRKSTRLNSSHT